MIERIITTLLILMVEKELLTFKKVAAEDPIEETNLHIAKLTQELMRQAQSAQIGTQFSSWLSKKIIEAPNVDELYASDTEIYQLLSDLEL
jgi:hypothetical protein